MCQYQSTFLIFSYLYHTDSYQAAKKTKKNGISDFQKSSQVGSINFNYLSKPLIIHR